MRYTKQATLSTLGLMALGGVLALYASRSRTPRLVHSVQELVPHDLEMDAHLGTAAVAGVAAVAALAAGGYFLSRGRGLRQGPSISHSVEESIEVDVPVSTAYNQWTQFESFPQFMASVQSVEQLDDTHLRWRAVVGGKVKEWEAEITEQIPDERIAWRSISGVPNDGVVTFQKVGDARSRVALRMNYTPETTVEKVGDAVGATKLTAKGNLKKFKTLLEARGHETGGWRGTVPQR
jgi:uncharacterized membrane protein